MSSALFAAFFGVFFGAPGRAAELSDCMEAKDPKQLLEICGDVANDDEADPEDRADAMRARADVFRARGDIAQEIAEYDTAISIDPDNPELFFSRGAARAINGNTEGAISDYSAAVRLDPDEAEYRLKRGVQCRSDGEVEGAFADFSAVVAAMPDLASAYFYRGELLQSSGDLERAIIDFGNAVRLDPNSTAALIARANTLRAKGDFTSAEKDYTEAIRLDDKLEVAYVGRASARLAQKDVEGALADLNVAIERAPNSASTRSLRGLVHAIKGNVEASLADHSAAVVLEPFNAYRLNVRAYAYLKANKLDMALRDSERAIASEPEFASAHATRGLILEALGKTNEAQASLTKALELEPRISVAREALVRLGGQPPAEPAAVQTSALAKNAPTLDADAFLKRNLDEELLSTPYSARDDAEVRRSPMVSAPPMSSVKKGDKLQAVAKVKYKVNEGCGIDGASAETPWIRVKLSGGEEGYLPSTSVASEEVSKLLAQREGIADVVANYASKNWGDLADFAGIYDGDSKCSPDMPGEGDGVAFSLAHSFMLSKQVIWFEGDTMHSVRFNNPSQDNETELTFDQNFELDEGGAIKLYQSENASGDSELLGFFRNKLVIGPTFEGNSISYNSALLCEVEDEMVDWAQKVIDGLIAAGDKQ